MIIRIKHQKYIFPHRELYWYIYWKCNRSIPAQVMYIKYGYPNVLRCSTKTQTENNYTMWSNLIFTKGGFRVCRALGQQPYAALAPYSMGVKGGCKLMAMRKIFWKREPVSTNFWGLWRDKHLTFKEYQLWFLKDN